MIYPVRENEKEPGKGIGADCGAECSTSGSEVDRTIRIEAPEGYSREAIDDFAIVVQETADALMPDGGAVVSGQYEPPAYEIRVTAPIDGLGNRKEPGCE